MKKALRYIWSVIEVIIIVYVIVITSIVLSKNKYGYTQFGDYTLNNISLVDERNIEDVQKGDLLIVQNGNDIQEGDRIYYYAAYNEAYVIRSDYVVGIEEDGDTALYTVQHNGENVTIVNNKVLGRYSRVYHDIGGILALLESRMGFLFLVLLPIMVVFIYQVYEFVTILRYEEVETPSKEEEKRSHNDVEVL